MSVLVVTSLGDIVVDLFTDKCPLTCKNFLKLCKIKYYNGCLFHSVQKDFTAQTGDLTGTGSGGDSVYKFLYGDQARFFGDEIHHDLKHAKMGTVAMASAGENLNASQFYFTLRDGLDYLDGKHTVFGEVAEGLETLSRINEAFVDEKNRPFKNIRIKHTYVLEDPFDDPPQLAELIPDASPEGKPKDEVDADVRLEDDWVPMDEKMAPEELEEVLRAKSARSSAVVLESIGDIPDAEIKPPDNVLFVCKLNPVTEDEDLHTIFSRFGTVVSADIIRDYKTGDSLCYAFIEFETKEACEQAYFKMDNALIDDRRIHVDFSQSVSKLWSQYRRNGLQTGKGRGCFKCGALDHVAKDCTGGPVTKLQPSKYILKDDNRQHGGDNSRYDMVFDEDSQSPRRERRNRAPDPVYREGNNRIRRLSSDDLNNEDKEKNEVSDRHRQRDRVGRYHREDFGHSGVKRDHNFHQGSDEERDSKRHKERDEWNDRKIISDNRADRRNDGDRRGRREENGIPTERREKHCRTKNADGHEKRKDDEDYRRSNLDVDDHVQRRDDGDHRKGRNANSRMDKDERDYRKDRIDDDRRDMRIESSHRKSSAHDRSEKDRREDRERRHGQAEEEREHRHRYADYDDRSQDRRHRRDRKK